MPSRRLGLSLGVDLLTAKTCSLDCLYCELGPTTNQTLERGRFRDLSQVLEQVARRLGQLSAPPDFITLAGSGEPCLSLDLGRALARMRDMSFARLAVLSNATLLGDDRVRAELGLADVVVPSLDAVSQAVFERLNRPAPGLKSADMVAGLLKLRQEMPGEMWLEILLVEGFNDSPEELALLVKAAEAIGPHKVQLGTVERPPAAPGVRALSAGRLEEIAAGFTVPVEVIPPPAGRAPAGSGALARQVVEMTRRRPCTGWDVAAMAGLSKKEADRLIAELLAAGRLKIERFKDRTFYRGV